MIISCPNCNKKFNIDERLIPDNGRLLQCSNCMNKWHYKIQRKEVIIEEKIKSEDKILEKQNEEIKTDLPQEFSSIQIKNSKKKIRKQVNIKKEGKKLAQKQKEKNNPIGLFNKIIVLLITLLALLIILDTFKSELSLYIASINPMLNSLYAIFTDINLFIKDLLR